MEEKKTFNIKFPGWEQSEVKEFLDFMKGYDIELKSIEIKKENKK